MATGVQVCSSGLWWKGFKSVPLFGEGLLRAVPMSWWTSSTRNCGDFDTEGPEPKDCSRR